MKGIVFGVLEEAVRRQYGEEAWDTILDGASASGVYTSLGTYEDRELHALVESASKLLGQPHEEVVRWFGRAALPLFAERYPEFFTRHSDTRSFLGTLNSIIHPEVRKIYPGANVPEFTFAIAPDGRLDIRYESERRLCAFAVGLIEGAASHFGEVADIEHTSCMLRGDPYCILRVRLSRQSAA